MDTDNKKSISERSKRIPGKDTELMREIEKFLGEFGFSRHQFLEYVSKMEEYDEGRKQLDKGNCYQYFNGRPVPLFNLLKIGSYLCGFESELSEENPELDAYTRRAEEINKIIIEYVVSNRNTVRVIRGEIRNILSNMVDDDGDAGKIKALFQSLCRFTVPERVWAFWACYCCLDCESQKEIKQLLGSFPISPKAYTERLYMLHIWEMEVNIPILLKYRKYEQEYQKELWRIRAEEQAAKQRAKKAMRQPSKQVAEKAAKEAMEQARKKFIEPLVGLLQHYPYGVQDIVHHFSKRALEQLDSDDWSIIATYSLLCSALDMEEQKQIDQTLLECLSDSANRRLLEGVDWSRVDFNHPPKVKTIPEKLVHYYMEEFKRHSVI